MKPIKTVLIATLLVSAAAVATPAQADNRGFRAERIAERIDRLEIRAQDLRDIRRLRVRLAEIDQLQARLQRMENRNDRLRGRLARQNDRRIDRLQAWLDRLEWRTERRLARRSGGYNQFNPYNPYFGY